MNPRTSTLTRGVRFVVPLMPLVTLIASHLAIIATTAWSREPGGASISTPAAVAQANGRNLRVDPASGHDGNDGVAAPVKSIARAIKVAEPGDTIHLSPARYKESAAFINKLGAPGRPITLDGHGAVLDGAEVLQRADWQLVGPGLYRNDHLLPMNPAILMRWFFIFDGKMVHMGRTSKGPSLPLKKPEELAPGEWTYVSDATITRESKDGKPWDAASIPGAFFLKIDPAKSLEDYCIEAPLRSAGVQFGGHCEHIVVRNVTATHVYNDGFNIHGDQRGLVFENIAAIECGDDGFSAHEAAECRIDGFVSVGNSTGLCDTVSCVTHYKNVFIQDCLGFDVYFIGDSQHSMENVLVESSAARTLAVSTVQYRPEKTPCDVVLRNVLLRRVGPTPGSVEFGPNTRFVLEHGTFLGLDVAVKSDAQVSVRQSSLRGEPKPRLVIHRNAHWQGEENLYDLASLRVDQTTFTAETFADFKKSTGGDVVSRWDNGSSQANNLGAEEMTLSRLKERASATLEAWRNMK